MVKKYFSLASFFTIGIFTLAPFEAFAQGCQPGQYSLIAPLGPLSGCVSLSVYLNGIVMTAIGVAGILAVIMLVICGIRVMASGSVSGKGAAKECIWNSLFGILLAIDAWILLSTINPALLSDNINLPALPVSPPQSPAQPGSPGGSTATVEPFPPALSKAYFYYRYKDTNGNTKNSERYDDDAACVAVLQSAINRNVTITPGPSGELGCFRIPPTATVANGDEEARRMAICGNVSCLPGSKSSTKVYVNRAACVPVGRDYRNGPPCTDVRTLPDDTIAAMKALASACNCVVTISGGTEAGHTTHALEKPIVDLFQGTDLDRLIYRESSIKDNGSFCSTQSGNRVCFRKWLYAGYWYTLETGQHSHWHVCKDGTTAPPGSNSNRIAVYKLACNKT